MRRGVVLLLSASWVVACAALTAPGSAGADVFEPISLVSAIAPPYAPPGHAEQADYAHDPAISGDGDYVAFDGSIGGISGVWRRDIATGAVEPVAAGPLGSPKSSSELPSISEEGRYVSFTTSASLVEGDHNEGPDVYVRDMDVGESEPDAFKLASAVSGTEESLTYDTSEPKFYGSVAAGGSALSASGEEVAFVTTAISDLAGPETPAMQVAVRNLHTKQTQLVSVVYDPAAGAETGEPVPTSSDGSSAVFPGAAQAPRFPLPPPLRTIQVGASISADGNAVAWLGQEIEKQAPTLPHEPHLRPEYTEPLWRQISEGPQAPTRRVTGGGDPTSPACIASGETGLVEPPSLSDPCQGPFNTEPPRSTSGAGTWTLGHEGDYLPRLSANGLTVAFLSNALYIPGGEEFGNAEESSDDLYVANMQPGLSRVEALTRLTEIAGGAAADIARVAPIADLAISPEGTQIAFSTQRTLFPLGAPALVSTPAAKPGMAELFDIDLANQTLTRVTEGFNGDPPEQPHVEASGGQDPYTDEQGAFSPSFSADGNTLAFADTASNLVYDDGNVPPAVTEAQKGERDGSNVYVVRRKTFSGERPQQYVSPPPAGPEIQPSWLLSVSARSRPNGSVVLYIVTPGAGRVTISAKGAVRVEPAGASRKGKRASRESARHARVSTRAAPRATVATRAVAAATATAHAAVGELVASTLTLRPHYRSLARQRGGLSATVSVVFSDPGHKVLRESVPVTFLAVAHGSRASKASRKR
jgi:hypothetical protein